MTLWLGCDPAGQALCFRECGSTYVPSKPWQHGEEPKRVTTAALLPPTARLLLEKLQQPDRQ